MKVEIESFDASRRRLQVELMRQSETRVFDIVILRDSGHTYAMDAICPHSGGPLFMGDLEDLGQDINGCSTRAIICPYHEYPFDLVTGASDMHEFVAETYPVECTDGYIVIELPVADGFAVAKLECEDIDVCPKSPTEKTSYPIVDTEEPIDLVGWAIRILNTSDPDLKVSTTNKVAEMWFSRQLPIVSTQEAPKIRILSTEPPRDPKLTIKEPSKMGRLGKGGSLSSRIAILHSLANIEQWAIDLAWDMIARFHQVETPSGDLYRMPDAFIDDFVRIAREEAKHFSLLEQRLKQLDSCFGALPVHNGLWESASSTAHDILSRLAIVHMVHEARGLDVNPATIAKFERAGDTESAAILTIIHNEEIGHVSAGHCWFDRVCGDVHGIADRSEKIERFQELVRALFAGVLKPPFNKQDRASAGLSEDWYMPLTHKS